jgi:hypothetical protein
MVREGSRFEARIPSDYLVSSGFEYYLLAREVAGRTVTLPETDPEQTPFRIDPSAGEARGVDILSPPARTDSPTPEILLLFAAEQDPARLHFVLDGQDLTAQAEIRPDYLFYLPALPLRPGRHEFHVRSFDVREEKEILLSYSFEILRFRAGRGLPLHGTASLGLQRAKADRDTAGLSLTYPVGTSPRGDIDLFGELWGTSYSSWVSYDRTYGTRPLFSTEISSRHLHLEFGDIYPTFSDLTLDAVASLGLDGSYTIGPAAVRALAVRLEGPDTLIGQYSRYLTGGHLQWNRGRVGLSGLYLHGFDDVGSLIRARRIAPPVRDDVFEAGLSLLLSGGAKLEAEYAWGYYDDDLQTSPGAVQAQAYRVALSPKRPGLLRWQLEYRNLDGAYQSLGAPYLERGQKGTDLFIETSIPGAFLGRITLGAFHQPDGWAGRQSVNLSYSFRNGSSVYASGDRSKRPYSADILSTLAGTIGGNLKTPWFSLTVSGGGSSSEYTYTTSSHNYALSAEIPLLRDIIVLKPGFQQYETRNTEGTVAETQRTPAIGLSLWPGSANALEFSFQYIDRQDDVSPSRNVIETVATLSHSRSF